MTYRRKAGSELENYFAQVRSTMGLVQDSLRRHKETLGDDAYQYLQQEWQRLTAQVQTEPLAAPEQQGSAASLPANVTLLRPIEGHNDNEFSPVPLGEKSPKGMLIAALQELRRTIHTMNDPIAGYCAPAVVDALSNEVHIMTLGLMGVGRTGPQAVPGIAAVRV